MLTLDSTHSSIMNSARSQKQAYSSLMRRDKIAGHITYGTS